VRAIPVPELTSSMRTTGNEVNEGRLRRWPGQIRRFGTDKRRPGCCTLLLHCFSCSGRAHGSGDRRSPMVLAAQIIEPRYARSASGPQAGAQDRIGLCW
jgi:hypothetical protein